MQKQEKKVLAVVSDLFFSVKITEAAKRAGLKISSKLLRLAKPIAEEGAR